MNDFEIAHKYFKRVFSGKNPMKKIYDIKDFPDINKLVIKKNTKTKDSKK
jgi:hypothetical protein